MLCYYELHFEENDILLFDKIILNDRTVNKIKRIKPILKTGIVSSIFPNFPFCLSIVRFFITMRMHFIVRHSNYKNKKEKQVE